MPIITGKLAYIAICIGSNIFNNIAANKNNDEIHRLNQDAQEAASYQNKDLMWKLLRESQEATVRMEKDKQEERIRDIQVQVKDLLEARADAMATKLWPLRVPPIVMTNQTIGNVISNNPCENVALHCIVTASNCEDFNRHVLPHIENELEAHFNKFWATNTSHPVLFYGNSWQSAEPTRVVIKSLCHNLRSLPTLVINPHFGTDGNLTFVTDMWGITNDEQSNSIDTVEVIPDSDGDEQHFQRLYTKDVFRKGDGTIDIAVVKECVEDLTPYLECLIGYIVDDYFWAAYGMAPVLPSLVSGGWINTDGMRYLVEDSKTHYKDFINKTIQCIEESEKDSISSINPLTKVPQLAEYVISTEQLFDAEECKDLNQQLIALSQIYTDTDCCSDAKSIKEFWSNEGIRISEMSVVPLSDYDTQIIPLEEVQDLDLATIITSFKSHILEIGDRLDSSKLSLYIAERDFEYYTFLMCDSESHDVINSSLGFTRRFFTHNTNHLKNIRSLFKFKNNYSIVCKFSSLDRLISKITDKSLKF